MPADGAAPTVVVSSVASDSHTWNLVFLQLLIEECGYHVVNLGPCVPTALLEAELRAWQPALLVMSTVNGHGYRDGLSAVTRLRAHPELATTPMVIGGKLSISGTDSGERVGHLLAAGFDAVFDETAHSVASFRRFLTATPRRAGRELR
ncbi:cobalamin-dependent protein [Streptomyces sp. M2CJ-2]|uniref:cobalamin-dependent protein n=1 Tax=Streptomyces sp. M2CJ-2 TaxID=2803948 RepID=UPI0019297B72|nr:cobalamin-dependent protein [Streptomyces sp. M2CJ-2]MBL3671391.1 cobalamin-dependent protein [Streptomyces sp. M2CJ-2]